MKRQASLNKKTLSQFLKERRDMLGITLPELEEKISVPIKYLKRIESNQWDKLPPSVYTRGFLAKYATFVGTSADEVLAEYERIIKDRSSLKPEQPKLISKISLSPQIFRLVLICAATFLVLGYITYQLSAIFASPNLSVIVPDQEEVVLDEPSVLIGGKAELGSQVIINARPVQTRGDGSFQERIDLLPGLNNFEIKAISKFNKETIVERRVIYQP